ncbi:male sterility protein-domain-containing protein [Mycena capillaripes]|nr:male sterility protein-domain-containing protein [Mycena capillaripes]
MQRDSDSVFFRRQTIFLTGGTGGLGGCLVFKLALAVDTAKIYVLVRGSVARAKSRWRETMPMHVEGILATGKIHFVVGDMTMKDLGIPVDLLGELAASVTLVIHSAADTSLTAPLRKSVERNCMPVLELARLASLFKRLEHFVHISTAFVNCFLPDGVVEERIYDVGDPEAQLAEIIETGDISRNTIPEFLWPYSVAKHLTERLLLSRYPDLPLLIVRPTNIGPAMAQPYPYYGPLGACPISTYIRGYITAPDSGVVHVARGNTAGANILDEIPYVPRSLAQMHADIRAEVPGAAFAYVDDWQVKEGRYALFWKVAGRDWRFCGAKSVALKGCGGPLSIDIEDHDVADFMRMRVRLIAKDIETRTVDKA